MANLTGDFTKDVGKYGILDKELQDFYIETSFISLNKANEKIGCGAEGIGKIFLYVFSKHVDLNMAIATNYWNPTYWEYSIFAKNKENNGLTLTYGMAHPLISGIEEKLIIGLNINDEYLSMVKSIELIASKTPSPSLLEQFLKDKLGKRNPSEFLKDREYQARVTWYSRMRHIRTEIKKEFENSKINNLINQIREDIKSQFQPRENHQGQISNSEL
jgi:hypothetical protein